MNKELIEKQIRELDTNNLITNMFIEKVEDKGEIDFYSIGLRGKYISGLCYDEVDIDYYPKKDRLKLFTENTNYNDDEDPTPVFVFAYNNIDKIKQIIKDNI